MRLEEIIGKNIRRLRIQKGWSQDDLAERYGCIKAYISQIENAKTWIGKDVFYRLCSILDARPEDLIRTQDNVEPLLAAKIKRIQESEYRELFDLLVEVLKDYEYADPGALAVVKAALETIRGAILERKNQQQAEPGAKLSNSSGD